jgi:hypothetical protein
MNADLTQANSRRPNLIRQSAQDFIAPFPLFFNVYGCRDRICRAEKVRFIPEQDENKLQQDL